MHACSVAYIHVRIMHTRTLTCTCTRAGAREEAKQIFERLGGEVDIIRKRFWNERALAAGEEQ